MNDKPTTTSTPAGRPCRTPDGGSRSGTTSVQLGERDGCTPCGGGAGREVLRDRGYRVDMEDGVGKIDVVAYGLDEPPFAVEVETNPTREVVSDELSRYYHGEPFCECYVLDPTEMPGGLEAAREWVEEKL